MINGLVLFAKTGGTTLALEDIVRPVAYHGDTHNGHYNLQCFIDKQGSTGLEVGTWGFNQQTDLDISFIQEDWDEKEIDIIHGSLPTEAEYARLVKRELEEEPGPDNGRVQEPTQADRAASRKMGTMAKRSDAEKGLYESIYELAKEIQPKFLFFETRRLGGDELVDVLTRCEGRASSSTWDSVTHEIIHNGFIGKLASLGYDCRWDTLSAYDVGSPQKRERVYLLARKRNDVNQTPSKDILPRDLERGYANNNKVTLPRPKNGGTVEGTPERVAEVKAGLDEVCVPQYREAFLRLVGLK
jgi:site-specific DNA-cytosine methylase